MPRIIRNYESLASSPLRRDALAIAESGYASIAVGAALSRKLRPEGDDLVIAGKRVRAEGRRILYVGVGKCAIAGAQAIAALLKDRLTVGIALDVRAAEQKIDRVTVLAGTHPKPSAANTKASQSILDLLSGCTESDLVIILISGGGSTLLCYPEGGMTCDDEGALFDSLTGAGASIQELNVVRKHLSKVRGGGMAAAAFPAEVVSLVISDVPGNDLEFIASGPTVRDTSSIADAEAVLRKYGLALPPGGFRPTVQDEKFFARVTNLLLLTNRDALDAMAQKAQELGYLPSIVDDAYSGEARDVASDAATRLHASPAKTALLWGGESIVTLPSEAEKGGRNLELALAAIPLMQEGELLLPLASDGCDATEFAGAIADTVSASHARERGLIAGEFLYRHASFDFFSKIGDMIDTGPLESNVSDLLVALKA